MGDPGLGKSQMLNAVVSVAPRGVAVTGNTSTAGGLTVTLTRSGIITSLVVKLKRSMISGRQGVTLHWMLELLFLQTRDVAVLMSLIRWPDRFA